MDERSNRKNFVVAGVLLILLGLLTGFIIPSTRNPRVAMSAHVEAIMGGMILLLVGGVVWEHVHFGERAARVVKYLLFYSTYSNWFFLLLAALWGTGKMLPIAARGFHGTGTQELIVSMGFVTSALSIVVAFIALLASMKTKPRQP
jgi:hydroxylaminobenzene mutase